MLTNCANPSHARRACIAACAGALLLSVLFGCRGRRGEPLRRDTPAATSTAATPARAGDDRWASVAAAIDSGPVPDVTVLVGTKDGVVWSRSRGAFSPEKVVRIASGSKWVTS